MKSLTENIFIHPPISQTIDVKTNSREHHLILDIILENLHPIDFYSIVPISDGEKLKRKHYIMLTVDEVIRKAKQMNLELGKSSGVVYCYNGEYWKVLPVQDIEHFLGLAAYKIGVQEFDCKYHSFKTDLVKQFLSSAYIKTVPPSPNEIFINLKNGTFVCNDGRFSLEKFNPQDFLTYQLPFNYNTAADCPKFHKYLNHVLPDVDQQKVLAEYLGYVLIANSVLKLEKCLVIYGTGANGKSVLFDIVTRLFGSVNISSYSLESLTDSSGYYRAMIGNKLLNYCPEISAHMNSTRFKQMVSGEPIEARCPFSEPVTLTRYAKLMFNTNELPKDVEHNEAFFRRFILLHFQITIPEEDRNPELANQIIQDELPGIFNWVLEGLKRLTRNSKFTVSQKCLNSLRDYRDSSDSVSIFLKDEGYLPDIESEIPLKTMYQDYKKYSSDYGYRATSLKVYADRLRNTGFVIHRKNKGNVVYTKKLSL